MSLNIGDQDDNSLIDVVARVSKIIGDIDTNRELIRKGQGFLAETQDRLTAFLNRQNETNAQLANINTNVSNGTSDDGTDVERKIGAVNNILSIEFLEIGLLASKSVGRFNMNDLVYGSGFHVGHQIVITNHHVIKNPDDAAEWVFELNAEDNKLGSPKQLYSYSLDPDKFFLTNEEYDFTLVAISNPEGTPNIETFGWHVLLDAQGKIIIGQPVNIIQHPNGENKRIVVHDSCLLYLDDQNQDMEKYCLYSSDTEEGSSGSPVFNNRWEVVALHHKAVPKTDKKGNFVDVNDHQILDIKDKVYIANEGVRVSRLVKAIKESNFEKLEQVQIRDELIKLWNEPGAHQRGLKGTDTNLEPN